MVSDWARTIVPNARSGCARDSSVRTTKLVKVRSSCVAMRDFMS